MRRRVRILLLLGGLVVLLLIGVGVWIHWAVQRVPPWYEQAVAPKEATNQQGASNQMEQRTAELISGLESTRPWEVLFTEAQINGWLAHGLPEKHADALPEGFSEPRVKIERDGISGACRIDRGAVSGVVSLKVDVYLAEPNTVAVRIRRARLGDIPWPLGKMLDGISQSARRNNIILSWRQTDGDPVALIRIPTGGNGRVVHVEKIQLDEGKIYIAGTTEKVKP